MVSLFLFALAAVFNALMDAFENSPNFHESIFRNLRPSLWLKEVSWQYAKKIFGYKLDAWHLSKSCMIASLAAAVIFYKQVFNPYIDFACCGIAWNLSFDVFYHWFFKVK